MSYSSSSHFPENFARRPKGAVIYTGPDGVGDHRVDVRDPSYVGHGSMSTEATSDTLHLYRAPKDAAYPRAKSAKVGEVGWGVVKLMDCSLLKSGHQIMLKEFRQANEDRYTHRYQTPYYPPRPSTAQPESQGQLPHLPPVSRKVTIQEPIQTSSQESSKISLTQKGF